MYLSHERRTLTLPGPAAPTPTFVVSSVTPTPTTVPSSQTALPTVLNQPLVSPAPSPTNTAGATSKNADGGGSKKVDARPIIGGVIGGVILVSLIAFGIWFFLRRRRAKEMDSMARGITPMLGSNGTEKFAMDNSPEFREERRSQNTLSGGVFGPFGGYHRTPTVPDVEQRRVIQPVDIDRPREAGQSMDIVPAYNMDDDPPEDMHIPSNEKVGLQAPPVESHPAYHPLPGQSRDIPTYYPGGSHPDHPPYTLRNLPSQRDNHPSSVALPGQSIASRSPELPDLLFSPIDLIRGAEQLDVIPITPQAELAAFPSPPATIPSSKTSEKKTGLRRSVTPPSRSHKPQRPRRQSTPPRHSAPLDRLTPAYNAEGTPSPAPRNYDAEVPSQSMTYKGLHISGMGEQGKRTTVPRPVPSERVQTYPSPTAGGRPELPASFPPPKRMPAFNHISLPSPIPTTPVQRDKSTGTSSTYSIPIGLASTLAQQNSSNNWPLYNHPVTSDAHHLRNQSSAISALSSMRDVQNASAVSELSVVPSTTLKHNHSRDLSAHSEHAHVMSWQDYDDEINEIGDVSEISPMFSPASANTSAMHHYSQSIVSPMTAVQTRTPYTGGSTFSALVGTRTPSQLRGAKTPSQQSLWERERERQEFFGDLSVQPLSMGKRWGEGLRKKTLGGAQQKRVPSEQLLNGGGNY